MPLTISLPGVNSMDNIFQASGEMKKELLSRLDGIEKAIYIISVPNSPPPVSQEPNQASRQLTGNGLSYLSLLFFSFSSIKLSTSGLVSAT